MSPLLRGDPAVVINYAPHLIVGGLVLIGLSLVLDGFGVITGIIAAGLGVAAAGLTAWRTERGLWMLAVVLLLMYTFSYVGICMGKLLDAWRRSRPWRLEAYCRPRFRHHIACRNRSIFIQCRKIQLHDVPLAI